MAERVLVCGSRTFQNPLPVHAMLQGLYVEHAVGWQVDHLRPFVVIEGGARGADSFAAWWAKESPLHAYQDLSRDGWSQPCWVDHVPVPAKWREHHKDWCPGEPCRRRAAERGRDYCVAAGARRNEQMLVDGRPDLVVFFLDKPLKESRGTADMVDRARRRGVEWFGVRV